MPQTKHAFMVLTAAILILIGGVVTLFTDGVGSALSFLDPQTALLIQTEELTPQVEVLRNTTREETRASLMSKLKAYVNDGREEVADKEAVVEEVSVSPTVIEEIVIEETKPSHILCNPNALPTPLSDWGGVNVREAEGARILTSLETDPSGAPVHKLQLPLVPVVTGVTACLPSSMVALALDGQVLEAGELVSTSAEGLAGYAIDGFPLFGSYEDGRELTSGDLDVCHGHVHTIIDQGVETSMYHYHVTTDEPYTLGCFRGTPVFE